MLHVPMNPRLDVFQYKNLSTISTFRKWRDPFLHRVHSTTIRVSRNVLLGRAAILGSASGHDKVTS